MKVLIANRGEIAVRVIRACRELGIPTVAVYSECDRASLHVRFADEAYAIGPSAPSESYLRVDKLMEVARRSGATAVHPGYGFLAENASFARACADAGLTFIGPSPAAMEQMGSKTGARKAAIDAGVPVVPGTVEPLGPSVGDAEIAAMAASIGYPVFVKAVAGGGGKGMRLVAAPEDLASAIRAARSEAGSSFGDPHIYIERQIQYPRHIEIQLLADAHGTVVPFAERECSIQRRHQKVLEESPSVAVTPETRAALASAACSVARAVGYTNAGTIEFLLDRDGRFYFLEMNTRLQVEHPITEMVTGIDLVERQIRVAEGGRIEPQAPPLRGAAVECRVYAEDPARNFLPAPGFIKRMVPPGGPGVRDDSGVYAGFAIPMEYDPMISKLVAWGENRAQALSRMVRALDEYQLTGVHTNIAFLKAVLRHPEFQAGSYDTHFILKHRDALLESGGAGSETEALAAAAVLAWQADQTGPAISFTARMAASPWKMAGRGGGDR
jgi:acetyl-CoA carboxylase, biotin carboxylase subunit